MLSAFAVPLAEYKEIPVAPAEGNVYVIITFALSLLNNLKRKFILRFFPDLGLVCRIDGCQWRLNIFTKAAGVALSSARQPENRYVVPLPISSVIATG